MVSNTHQLFPAGKTGSPAADWLLPQSVQTRRMEPHHTVETLERSQTHSRQRRPEAHMLQEVIQYAQEVGYLDCSCSPSEDRTPAPVSQSGYLAAVVLDFLSSSTSCRPLSCSLSASAVILNLARSPLVPSFSLRHHSLLLPHSLSLPLQMHTHPCLLLLQLYLSQRSDNNH